MKVKMRYVGSNGDEVVFWGRKAPFQYGRSNLFDLDQEYRSTGGRITGISRSIREIGLTVFMRGGSLAERDRFLDIISYDARELKPGKLWVGQSYISCFFLSYEVSEALKYESQAVYECTLVTDQPYWVRSKRYTLTGGSGEIAGTLDYPRDYPYDYVRHSDNMDQIANPFPTAAKVNIAFAGPATEPYLRIGQNRYQVHRSVERGQLLLVRGFGPKQEIVIRHSDGTETSALSDGERSAGAYIFATVPPGRHTAAWGGNNAIEVELFEERSAPAWAAM
ncbi:hypothetical protein [Parvibacter caecicola]|uniref:Uncharacterized protein n=2 Tax=Parvibacter caecicola TaxID=747645 RepID=A0A7W5D2Z5_9ACTN|nr:hypothetical protein [Parvibacter caecicola]MBB3171806.1 hypothetical protein [Parvibacter caecicola]MCR2040635.1 hypothetical protein [Parvibacter caecicola]RNL10814.1 hypothetical protein DMP11_06090 [Parvibacter caecicola]